ncbi:cytochrome b N-terminal domain-containing protein [Stratiformator vulcanicus]|uniref:Cytochrome b6 n=1 Tax=Stratiformator vulcanicus TaxID=2527980 RepID=A0A517QXL0_9PLAN|nr:cytochrome b N-terminal domain-containing protein [Stratiformator vulcanicus]QDT36396.1 Cytochrome b6 [Stratiformator vulcanicus]
MKQFLARYRRHELDDNVNFLATWIDDRTGYQSAWQWWVRHSTPVRPSWWNVTGPLLISVALLVAITGIGLAATYSPSSDHAWASVQFIESIPGGGFLRGLHYYGSHALVVLFGVHLIRLILTAAYRSPREIGWIAFLLLIPIVATAAVTGNPLSASGKAVAQIEVEGNIIGAAPVVGPILRTLLHGGSSVGHLTFIHLYLLHVLLLPLIGIGIGKLHIYLWLRNSRAAEHLPDEERSEIRATQRFMTAIAITIMFAALGHLAYHYGAPLDAPADPDLAQEPRPEWYFFALFELRSYFTGTTEFLATQVLPGVILGFLIVLPWIDRILARPVAKGMRMLLVIIGLGGFAYFTYLPISRDHADEHYQEFLVESAELGKRADFLAKAEGIPPGGPVELLRNDPKTRGPALFVTHCASCHSHIGKDALDIVAKKPSAPNLGFVASREWIAGLLDPDRIAGPEYFGNTAFGKAYRDDGYDEMISYVKEDLYGDLEGDELAARKEEVRKIVLALSAEAELPYQAGADADDIDAIGDGRLLLSGEKGEVGCADCHPYRGAGYEGYPDLNGYGSQNWLAEFIANPSHERFYGDRNDRMPAFKPEQGDSPQNVLSEQELLLIVDWLRRDWLMEQPDTSESPSTDKSEPSGSPPPDEAGSSTEAA